MCVINQMCLLKSLNFVFKIRKKFAFEKIQVWEKRSVEPNTYFRKSESLVVDVLV
jgi:hypothetical protein